jgi:hypothetical protein
LTGSGSTRRRCARPEPGRGVWSGSRHRPVRSPAGLTRSTGRNTPSYSGARSAGTAEPLVTPDVLDTGLRPGRRWFSCVNEIRARGYSPRRVHRPEQCGQIRGVHQVSYLGGGAGAPPRRGTRGLSVTSGRSTSGYLPEQPSVLLPAGFHGDPPCTSRCRRAGHVVRTDLRIDFRPYQRADGSQERNNVVPHGHMACPQLNSPPSSVRVDR